MNGVQGGKRSKNEAVTQRAERGMRVGDFEYRPSYLELGMLSGNAFVITLRCVDGLSDGVASMPAVIECW